MYTRLKMNKLYIAIAAFGMGAFVHAQQKPNVLFISVDDLKPMLGAYGDSMIQSPHIDNIAQRGVVFQNAYCQQAVCAPSRISLFTGMRPDRTGVLDLQTYMRDVNPDIVTLPQFFKQNGYITAGFGKLMHGARNNDPVSWSIPYKEDKFLTYAKGFKYPANGKFQNNEIQKAMTFAEKQKLSWKETNQYLKSKNLNPSIENLDIPDDAYSDGAIAKAAINLLDQLKADEKPFFLALGFHKPHLPFSVPKKYWDFYDRDKIKTAPYKKEAICAPVYAYHTWGKLRNYSDIPQKGPVPIEKQKELIHGYMASVSYVDAQIGLVLDKLKQLGLANNTIVVLWGDHGWHLGDHGLWCKHSNFEQATKSPLIISAPGMAKNRNADTMAEFVDLFPTLLDLSGFSIPDYLEGTSLKPAMVDPETVVKDYALSQYPRGNDIMGYSVRTERYRFTLWLEGKFRSDEMIENPVVRGVELYDYVTDPQEKVSLAGNNSYAEVEEELKEKLLTLLNQQKSRLKSSDCLHVLAED